MSRAYSVSGYKHSETEYAMIMAGAFNACGVSCSQVTRSAAAVQSSSSTPSSVGRVIISTGAYPKVSGLAAWSENYKRYSSLPPGAVLSLFCESV